MKIYLNESEVNKNYSEFTLPRILTDIKSELNGQIIKEIYLNDVEINERYLKDSLVDKEDIKEIKFITQKNNQLIKETLEEIDSYLPRLKKGCLDAAELFRNGKNDEANNKLQLIFEGLNWYTQSTYNIVNLLKDEKIKKKVSDNLLSLNKFLEELHEAQENDDNILIADILEFEIVDFIDKFISLTIEIINYIKKDSDNNGS